MSKEESRQRGRQVGVKTEFVFVKVQNANECSGMPPQLCAACVFVFIHNRQLMMLMTADRPVLRACTAVEAKGMTGLCFCVFPNHVPHLLSL